METLSGLVIPGQFADGFRRIPNAGEVIDLFYSRASLHKAFYLVDNLGLFVLSKFRRSYGGKGFSLSLGEYEDGVLGLYIYDFRKREVRKAIQRAGGERSNMSIAPAAKISLQHTSQAFGPSWSSEYLLPYHNERLRRLWSDMYKEII